MKNLNHLMLIAAVATLGVSLSAQTCNSSASAELTSNAALLASPRYREVHPELLVGRTSGGNRPQIGALTDNIALADSPRYREDHPDLLRSILPAKQKQAVSEADRMRKLTENGALAASPRFREVHPELLLTRPVFEIAPVK
jgi:hypothetical protein